MKTCITCKIEKTEDDFHKNRSTKDGLDKRCKQCQKSYDHFKHIKVITKNGRKRTIYNKFEKDGKIFKYCRNCGETKEISEFYKSRENSDGYNGSCKSCIIKRNTKFFDNNRDIMMKAKIEYSKERRIRDIDFKIRVNIRGRLHKFIKSGEGNIKFSDLVGCTNKELRDHIESQFKSGMSWGNYGAGIEKWVIDHKKPCVLFDLKDPAEQRKCFNYTNLQPLWWSENSSKGARF